MKKVCFNVLSSVMAIQREMALQRVGKTVRIEFSMSNQDGLQAFEVLRKLPKSFAGRRVS